MLTPEPPLPRTSPLADVRDGSPSTATSSSLIRSSQAPPHHRDRLLQPSTIVIHYVDSPPSLQHRLHRDLPELPYYETDAAAGAPVDYVVDDPYLPEQPDAGAQEPDATVDDDSYYTRGAYYYVQAADDDQE
ncbi:uncharacterized protein [Aegilops tauschii subsp. strangulata]|uniref:uncharacterized protein n=1 Tax=Aegilops tauschii subsp. strangulata TaxID=200361 RepID=UPI003CC8A7C3